MNLSRRSLLTSLIAAPAVIAADRLMPIKLWLPTIYGDGVHDDWEGLMAWKKGEPVNILSREFAHDIAFPERYYLPAGRRHGIIAVESCLLDDKGIPSRYNMMPVFYKRENII